VDIYNLKTTDFAFMHSFSYAELFALLPCKTGPLSSCSPSCNSHTN